MKFCFDPLSQFKYCSDGYEKISSFSDIYKTTISLDKSYDIQIINIDEKQTLMLSKFNDLNVSISGLNFDFINLDIKNVKLKELLISNITVNMGAEIDLTNVEISSFYRVTYSIGKNLVDLTGATIITDYYSLESSENVKAEKIEILYDEFIQTLPEHQVFVDAEDIKIKSIQTYVELSAHKTIDLCEYSLDTHYLCVNLTNCKNLVYDIAGLARIQYWANDFPDTNILLNIIPKNNTEIRSSIKISEKVNNCKLPTIVIYSSDFVSDGNFASDVYFHGKCNIYLDDLYFRDPKIDETNFFFMNESKIGYHCYYDKYYIQNLHTMGNVNITTNKNIQTRNVYISGVLTSSYSTISMQNLYLDNAKVRDTLLFIGTNCELHAKYHELPSPISFSYIEPFKGKIFFQYDIDRGLTPSEEDKFKEGIELLSANAGWCRNVEFYISDRGPSGLRKDSNLMDYECFNNKSFKIFTKEKPSTLYPSLCYEDECNEWERKIQTADVSKEIDPKAELIYLRSSNDIDLSNLKETISVHLMSEKAINVKTGPKMNYLELNGEFTFDTDKLELNKLEIGPQTKVTNELDLEKVGNVVIDFTSLKNIKTKNKKDMKLILRNNMYTFKVSKDVIETEYGEIPKDVLIETIATDINIIEKDTQSNYRASIKLNNTANIAVNGLFDSNNKFVLKIVDFKDITIRPSQNRCPISFDASGNHLIVSKIYDGVVAFPESSFRDGNISLHNFIYPAMKFDSLKLNNTVFKLNADIILNKATLCDNVTMNNIHFRGPINVTGKTEIKCNACIFDEQTDVKMIAYYGQGSKSPFFNFTDIQENTKGINIDIDVDFREDVKSEYFGATQAIGWFHVHQKENGAELIIKEIKYRPDSFMFGNINVTSRLIILNNYSMLQFVIDRPRSDLKEANIAALVDIGIISLVIIIFILGCSVNCIKSRCSKKPIDDSNSLLET